MLSVTSAQPWRRSIESRLRKRLRCSHTCTYTPALTGGELSDLAAFIAEALPRLVGFKRGLAILFRGLESLLGLFVQSLLATE
jgi:hypothetical protein